MTIEQGLTQMAPKGIRIGLNLISRVIDFLREREDVASTLACETIGNPFIRRHQKTGAAVVMERAQAHVIPALLDQLAILRHKLLDGKPSLYFVLRVHGRRSIAERGRRREKQRKGYGFLVCWFRVYRKPANLTQTSSQSPAATDSKSFHPSSFPDQ